MRILSGGEWFEAVTPSAMYETEYQEIVKTEAESLFGEYMTVRFDRLVESEDGAAKADLALIDRQYRFWWIVEIEMATHSLESHVLPQVRKLSRARYGAAEAHYLTAKSPTLDHEQLQDMMKGAQPRVLVVVNAAVPTWVPALTAYDSILSVVEVFRSNRNRHLLRMNGSYPDVPSDAVSECRLDPGFPRLLRIDSPAGLSVAAGTRLSIRYNGGVTEWVRIDSQTTVWLNPVGGPSPLEARTRYLIRRNDDGSLCLEKKT